ncbi:alpha/beta hydrolase [Planctomycetia bacterium]|jgi:pimeloyl-ACP methyl ester carboxylesterase|nr:alpha/beta hydrolase [Planctomycetia bacterium]
MTTHMLTVRDARLAVHTRGTGIPCVLLHGFPLDHSMWREQEPLAEHLRLIVPDLRGFGGSTGAVMESVESLADDVPALLDALHVAGPAVICGLSMGGYVAQHVAVRHPDRVAALVLVDTKLEADTPEARAARADLAVKVGRLGQGIVADAMVPRLLAPAAAAAPGRAAIEDVLRSAILAQPIAGIQAALAALAARPDMTEPMAHVLAPTLLVCGAEDAITPPDCLERAAEVMPCARLLIVPGAGHMTPLEAPEVFNRALLEFLQHPPGVGLPGLAGRD